MFDKGFPLLNNRNNQNDNRKINNGWSNKGSSRGKIEMPQFFDLPSPIPILNPYNFEEAKKRLESLPDEYFVNDLSCFQKKNFDFVNTDINVTFQIESYSFLTSKKDSNNNFNFLQLFCSDNIKDSNSEKQTQELKFINNDRKKEINVKTYVDFKKFCEKIFNKMCDISPYKTSSRLKEKIKNSFSELDEDNAMNKKRCEFDLEIKANSINCVYYSDNDFIFDLQHPPIYKTNFLKEPKDDNIDFGKYETNLFPYRDFDNEISNLKYRRLFFYIKKENTTLDGGEDGGNDDNLLNINVNSIISSIKSMISPDKIKEVNKLFFSGITLTDYTFCKKHKLKSGTLSEYFDFQENQYYYQIFQSLNFIQPQEKVPDLYVLKLYYQILALISENILSYYNAIDFVENILMLKEKNYKESIFKECSLQDYPLLFNETLTRILDTYQNSGDEYTLALFENLLRDTFVLVNNDFITKGMEITQPSKNKNLIRIQRAIVTPTYTLFTPYILDQGNRILRTFVKDPLLGMICVFKMDDYNEGRWGNAFLIEFIKYILSKGLQLTSHYLYRFFNFSQSQFRNMSCWLLTEPEKILPLTGDYSKIKVVAKYGARISQTLTTTQKTIIIRKDCIKCIDDIVVLDEKEKVKYTFSDGVGKISYPLARKLADYLHLDTVPSAFQGRFLGCKGVWATMYDDMSENIYIRPTQTKFDVAIQDEQYFELCDYSRYIQAYLNRQIILLLSSLGVNNEIFMKKLNIYRKSLEDEKFVLSLIHYEEWNKTFMEMYSSGIGMKNDRLIKSLVDNNKTLLYQDLKAKARIYIGESAYVIGIMDEYGILEYGEAFLHIKRRNLDLILNKNCTVAKCPCLHPGDIRVLSFKKYIPGEVETEKYKIFEKYENVIIFPQKGHRPHPNELSGSDLDGDNYFIFYDSDLVPQRLVEPMNYNFDLKQKKKDKITLKHVIKYFAEYINKNNLGIIGDAHLAKSDEDPKGADGDIPKGIAIKFSRAVDAPKTGDAVELSQEEIPEKFPHFMEKKNKPYYISKHILGIVYDKTKGFLDELSHDNENMLASYYDNDLKLKGSMEKYGLLALVLYKEYFEEIIKILKKNEIKSESVLLTGNNIDNDFSIFAKKKNNYDLRERVTNQMNELFRKYSKYFGRGIKYLFKKASIQLQNTLNQILTVNDNHLFSSACYIISYNFVDLLQGSSGKIRELKDNLVNYLTDLLLFQKSKSELDCSNYYICDNLQIDLADYCNESYQNAVLIESETINEIHTILDQYEKSVIEFLNICKKSYQIPKSIEEENQYRIISFPWCISGSILSKIKYLSNNK